MRAIWGRAAVWFFVDIKRGYAIMALILKIIIFIILTIFL